MRVSEATAKRIVAGNVVLKRNLNKSEALRFARSLKRMGLITAIKVEKAKPQDGKVGAAEPQKQTAGKETPEQGAEPYETSQTSERRRSGPGKVVRQLTDQISNQQPQIATGRSYKLNLILSIAMSYLAPLLYLGFIVGLVWLEYVFFQRGVSFTSLILMFVTAIIILFLLKPLLTAMPKDRDLPLKESDQRALFVLVRAMCQSIGVPEPTEICVNNDVNASAGSIRGTSALKKGELRLKIGLPLVAGMSATELIGVLAHEFGHFAQRSAMLAYHRINATNYWFASRAYEEDAWDRRIRQWGNGNNLILIFVGAYIEPALSYTRKLLHYLFLLNTLVTRSMSRQMEYDADLYESFFVGADQFEKTSLTLRRLSLAMNDTFEANLQAWNESLLFESIPDAVSKYAGLISEERMQELVGHMDDVSANAWDSHPADNDRINHVQQRGEPGILQTDLPATALFRNFEDLAKQITEREYRRDGFADPQEHMVPSARIIDFNRQQANANEAIQVFFNGHVSGRLLNLDSVSDTDTSSDAIINLLRPALVDYDKQLQSYEESLEKTLLMMLGRVYLNSGISIVAEHFYLSGQDPDQANSTISREMKLTMDTDQQMKKTDSLFFERVKAAIKLIGSAEQILAEEAKSLLQAVTQMCALRNVHLESRRVTQLLEYLLREDEEQYQTAIYRSVEIFSRESLTNSQRLFAMATDIPCILAGSEGVSTFSEFAKSWIGGFEDNPSDNPYQVLSLANEINNAFYYQYFRMLARLCEVCLITEEKHGVAKLKLVDIKLAAPR